MDSIPLCFRRHAPAEMHRRCREFADDLCRRRSVRTFSPEPIPDGLLENCLRVAGSAPSGANLQPWHFAVVTSAAVKHRIRQAAEKEERAFYATRAPDPWLEALAPLGTDARKPFLETAPALIIVFQKATIALPNGQVTRTYYPKESVGIATGFLIAALHRAGLATLTHTPSPMAFLNAILDRPTSEKPFALLVTGFPADQCRVPAIHKLPLNQIVSWH